MSTSIPVPEDESNLRTLLAFLIVQVLVACKTYRSQGTGMTNHGSSQPYLRTVKAFPHSTHGPIGGYRSQWTGSTDCPDRFNSPQRRVLLNLAGRHSSINGEGEPVLFE